RAFVPAARAAAAAPPPAAAGPPAVQELLVPARAATEVARLLAGLETARLTVPPTAGALRVDAGETSLVARLAAGRFPDVGGIVPRTWNTGVRVEAAAFRQAVRVAGLFGASGTGGGARPVVFDPLPAGLRLAARGDDTGDAEGELPATVIGAPGPVVLDARLLADVVDAASSSWLQPSRRSAGTPAGGPPPAP